MIRALTSSSVGIDEDEPTRVTVIAPAATPNLTALRIFALLRYSRVRAAVKASPAAVVSTALPSLIAGITKKCLPS